MNDSIPTTPAPDHLEVLALRSMHSELTLQPRRASLFESEIGGLVEETSEFVAGQLLASAPPAARESIQPFVLRQQTENAPPHNAIEERENQEQRPPVTPAPRIEYLPHAPDVLPHTGEPHLVAEPALSVSTTRMTDTPAPDRPVVSTRVDRLFAPSHLPAPAHHANVQDPPAPARPVVVAPPSSAEPSSRPAQPRQVPPAEHPNGAMVARAVPEMRGITPLFAQPLVRTQDAEPAIEISIGKLEIRATAPATPQKTQATPQPPRPLKEYLNRRTGAGR